MCAVYLSSSYGPNLGLIKFIMVSERNWSPPIFFSFLILPFNSKSSLLSYKTSKILTNLSSQLNFHYNQILIITYHFTLINPPYSKSTNQQITTIISTKSNSTKKTTNINPPSTYFLSKQKHSIHLLISPPKKSLIPYFTHKSKTHSTPIHI